MVNLKMRPVKAIISLMRLPNVVIIILTMFLLRYGLLRPFLFKGETGMMSGWLDFSLLVLATVLISVAGYVINDILDAGIDAINKPGRNMIGREVSLRSAHFTYRILNALGLLMGAYLGFRLQSLTFFLIFPFVIFLLYLYSSRYKKTLYWGNIAIAALSSLVVFLVWYFEFLHLRLNPQVFSDVFVNLKNVNVFFIVYAGFAFLVSLSREIIKDIEDRKGDEEYNCRTLVIVYGANIAKIIASVIMVLTILMLGLFQQILANRGWTAVVFYFIITVQIPLIYIIVNLFRANKQSDLHFLSNLSKLVMLAGILSIQLIYSSL